MKNTWKRIIALCLCLVMVAVLLPVTNAQAAVSDLTTSEIGLLHEDFTQYTSITDLTSLSNYVKHSSNVVYEDNLVKAGGKTSDSCITFSFDVDIPASNDSMVFYIKYEAVISAPQDTTDGSKTKKYMCDINAFYDREGNTISNKPTTVSGSSSTIAFTDGYEKVTLVYQIKNTSDIGRFEARLGARKDTDSSAEFNETGYVYIKSFKISILATECAPDSADMITAMAYEDAYVKLTDDVSLTANADLGQDGSLTLGKNAVLDLNGHTLTLPAGKGVMAGTNARIIDSSEVKTGKVVVEEGGLTLANTSNPQLPLFAGDGYIFTEPELGDSRAFFVDGSVSANGFTLDFRPGFGEAGGQNVREAYLKNGDCGIDMDATLSWTDLYGTDGSADLNCDSVFTGMYQSAASRGRLTLSGADKYMTISLSITLSSCGVFKTFELPVFSNAERLTIHVQNAEGLTLTGKTGANVVFQNKIDAVNGGTLVLDFNVKTAAGADDKFAFRLITDSKYALNTSKAPYVALFGTNGCGGNNVLQEKTETGTFVESHFYRNSSSITETANVNVHCRIELDIESGAWTAYKDGNELASGTYPTSSNAAKYNCVSAKDVLDEISEMVIRSENDSATTTFTNVLIYTIKKSA